MTTKVTIVVALIPGRNRTVAAIHQVVSLMDVDVKSVIKRAAAEFLETPEGEDYLDEICYDQFNWGDAFTAIPTKILNRHGVYSCEPVVEGDDLVLVVNHDEGLVREQRRHS